MNIFSIANLACAQVASKDAFERNLFGVQFEEDGSTVGCNGKVLMAVSPADTERAAFPEEVCDPLSPPRSGFLIPLDLVAKVLKNMSKVKRLHLMHVCMSRIKDIHRVAFTSVDEKGDTTTTSGFPRTDPFIKWKSVVTGVHKDCSMRVAVNRTDLVALLKSLESACPAKGDIAPLYLEVGDGGMVLRGQNFDTGQRAIGVITSLDTKGKWLDYGTWETQLFHTAPTPSNAAPVKKRLKRRLRK